MSVYKYNIYTSVSPCSSLLHLDFVRGSSSWLNRETDWATMSSTISSDSAYSESRTTMAYTAGLVLVGCKVKQGRCVPASIFSRDCAVTACFLERSCTYGTRHSKSGAPVSVG